jgi:hypothetical protein
MKIALCLFGFPRTYKKGYKDLKKYLLDKYDIDIYCHLWWKQNNYSPKAPWISDPLLIMDEDIKNEIQDLYNPKKIIMENPDDFIHKNTNEVDKLILDEINSKTDYYSIEAAKYCYKAIPSMFYSMTTCVNLALDSKIEYDFIIRTRYDINIQQDLPDIYTLSKEYIYINPPYNKGCGCADLFSICSSNIAKIAYNIYPFTNDFLLKSSCAEALWLNFLKDNNIEILNIPNQIPINHEWEFFAVHRYK